MQANVICLSSIRESRVKYTGKSNCRTVKGVEVPEPRTKKEYLAICKSFLETEDYEEILCGIVDEEYYEAMEGALRRIVDSYYDFPM
jgi:hypothetical protein